MNAYIRKYVPNGSYGFICDPTIGDVFFHSWVFDTAGGPPPIVGEAVSVVLGSTPSDGGLPRADVVKRVSPVSEKTGVVSKFDPVRGYGFVKDPSGEVFYLHKSDIAEGVQVAAGVRVRFYASGGGPQDSGKRPRACYVTFDR